MLVYMQKKDSPLGTMRGNAQATDPETGTPLSIANRKSSVWESNQLLGNAQADWIGSIRNSFSYTRALALMYY